MDNGSEFADCPSMERSALGDGSRTKLYYCHPYSSYERGSNENLNKMIRRPFPSARRWIARRFPPGAFLCSHPSADIKLGKDHELAEYIERRIADDKLSPAAVLGEIEANGMSFKTSISVNTLYSYIEKGVFLRLTNSFFSRYIVEIWTPRISAISFGVFLSLKWASMRSRSVLLKCLKRLMLMPASPKKAIKNAHIIK